MPNTSLIFSTEIQILWHRLCVSREKNVLRFIFRTLLLIQFESHQIWNSIEIQEENCFQAKKKIVWILNVITFINGYLDISNAVLSNFKHSIDWIKWQFLRVIDWIKSAYRSRCNEFDIYFFIRMHQHEYRKHSDGILHLSKSLSHKKWDRLQCQFGNTNMK